MINLELAHIGFSVNFGQSLYLIMFSCISMYIVYVIDSHPLHCTEVQFCQFPFRWIYYGSNKSTGKGTGKMHLCALVKIDRQYAARILTPFEKIHSKFNVLGI